MYNSFFFPLISLLLTQLWTRRLVWQSGEVRPPRAHGYFQHRVLQGAFPSAAGLKSIKIHIFSLTSMSIYCQHSRPTFKLVCILNPTHARRPLSLPSFSTFVSISGAARSVLRLSERNVAWQLQAHTYALLHQTPGTERCFAPVLHAGSWVGLLTKLTLRVFLFCHASFSTVLRLIRLLVLFFKKPHLLLLSFSIIVSSEHWHPGKGSWGGAFLVSGGARVLRGRPLRRMPRASRPRLAEVRGVALL